MQFGEFIEISVKFAVSISFIMQALMMEATSSYETWLTLHQMTRRHIYTRLFESSILVNIYR